MGRLKDLCAVNGDILRRLRSHGCLDDRLPQVKVYDVLHADFNVEFAESYRRFKRRATGTTTKVYTARKRGLAHSLRQDSTNPDDIRRRRRCGTYVRRLV
jgi:hypothetical protein